MLSDQQVITQLEQHQKQINAMNTEVVAWIRRTEALEARTDRMMNDSAESRVETRKSLADILLEIRSLREFRAEQKATQAEHREGQRQLSEAEKEYQARVRFLKTYWLPVLISIVALAQAAGWLW